MAKITRATKGPKTGPQKYVKYCPNCRGDIRSVKARKHPAEMAHSYQCDVCGREFEINDLYIELAIE